jgi:hypothetical protein
LRAVALGDQLVQVPDDALQLVDVQAVVPGVAGNRCPGDPLYDGVAVDVARRRAFVLQVAVGLPE